MSILCKLGIAGVVLASFACSAHHLDEEPRDTPVEADEAIVHGARDGNRHPAVVAVVTTNSLCSGSLIAPSVVLTARHCVAPELGEQLTCPTRSPQVGATRPASDFAIVIGPDVKSGSVAAWGKRVHVPSGNVLCDADIAVIELDRAIPGIEPLRVAEKDLPRAGARIVAVGYGRTGTQSEAGVRMLRADVPVLSTTANEFVVAESVCNGDSGGPAIDEETGAVIGVVSRGTSRCEGSASRNIYSRVTAWLDLLQPFLPHEKPGGGDPKPDLGDQGDPCANGASCASGVCVSAQPSGYCSRTCGGDAGRCPAGYHCMRNGAKSSDHGVCAKKT